MIDRELVSAALGSPEWRAACSALFRASGITLNVMDFDSGELLFGGSRCSYCQAAIDLDGPNPENCFDSCPKPDAALSRVSCRAGIITLVAPIIAEGSPVAHVVAGGFVTSTRERRKLFEQSVARGATADAARLSVKAMPVVTRREVEAFVQVAVSVAEASIVAASERQTAEERTRDMRIIESVGRTMAFADVADDAMLTGILGEALAATGAPAAALLVPSGDELEVAVVAGAWRGGVGARVPRATTASGRAATTRRPILVPVEQRNASATFAIPVLLGPRVLGVVELRLPPGATGVDPEVQRRVERFTNLLATILERRRSKLAADRTLASYAELDEFAASLARLTDLDRIEEFVLSVLRKSFDAKIVGVAITSWGRDRAVVRLDATVSQADVDSVLAEAMGRNLDLEPLASVTVNEVSGTLEADGIVCPDWRVLAVPMEAGSLEVGYVFIAGCDEVKFDSDDQALIERLAAHAGAALERAALFGRIRDDYAKTIAALSATLDASERVERGHAHRVMDYCLLIAEELGLTLEEYEQLRFAGLLHDVGKTGLPHEILLKPGKLTPPEVLEMQRHAEMGASIVEQIDFLKALTPIILHHHERWDGKGYPMGLVSGDIPMLARVLAVADAFDAMTSDRPFRKAMSFTLARAELQKGAGTQFDPRMVAALFEALDRQVLAGGTGLLAPSDAQGRPDLPA